MATPQPQLSQQSTGTTQQVQLALYAMLSLYFLFGLVTVMNDILIPHLKAVLQLQNWQANLIQSFFFGAYFIMSVPAGVVLKKLGFQKGIVAALALVAVGLLGFVPASMAVSFPMFLGALFLIGTGFTVLQVAANPYVSLLGPAETAASRLNMAGFLNSAATTFGPLMGAKLILIDANLPVTERAAAVQVPYVMLAVFVLVLAATFSFVKLPSIASTESHGPNEGSQQTNEKSAWAYPHLLAGMGAIFSYVGVEVAVGSIMVLFATQQLGISDKEAALYVSLYWGGLWVGRTLGIGLMKAVASQTALRLVVALSIVGALGAMVYQGFAAVWALVAIGLFHSIMWPCIFPMAIKGLGPATAQGSAMLVSMIVGGAIFPPIMGLVADAASVSTSLLVLLVGYGYLMWYAMTGFKLGLKE